MQTCRAAGGGTQRLCQPRSTALPLNRHHALLRAPLTHEGLHHSRGNPEASPQYRWLPVTMTRWLTRPLQPLDPAIHLLRWYSPNIPGSARLLAAPCMAAANIRECLGIEPSCKVPPPRCPAGSASLWKQSPWLRGDLVNRRPDQVGARGSQSSRQRPAASARSVWVQRPAGWMGWSAWQRRGPAVNGIHGTQVPGLYVSCLSHRHSCPPLCRHDRLVH